VKKRGERKYLKGKTEDIHEKDARHKIDAQEMYVSLAKRYPHWVMINCVEDGAMKSVEEIHADILRLLKEKHII
jgi:dTMP kinase